MPAGPSLPKRNGKREVAKGQLPIMQASYITLEDGTQVPVKIPPGMSSEQAEMVLEAMRQNPDLAKAASAQAKAMLSMPGFASMLQNNPELGAGQQNQQVFAAMKDDPEFQPLLEDIANNGPAAMAKYWEDGELMAKLSAKLRAMNVAPPAGAPAQPQPGSLTSLHDAAKWGDIESGKACLAAGKDVNERNERGVTPLGVAVGYNRKEFVQWLLDSGADVMRKDKGGNTVLHYAAGYGRLEVAEVLLAAGAVIDAVNGQNQMPANVAKMNKEMAMVEFLVKRKLELAAGAKPAEADAAPATA